MKFVLILSALLATGAAGSASAAITVRDVAIENASFEASVLTDGTFFRTSFPGWIADGTGVGIFNPSEGANFNATDGQNVINLDTYRQSYDTADSSFLQLLNEVVTKGVDYTLSVDAIRRGDGIDIGPWFAEIVATGTGQLGATTVAKGTLGNADVAPGAAKTLSFSYTGSAADVGKQLGIRFRSVYDAQQTPIRQVLLDNVRMTAAGDITAAVPEPATWAMMLLGFGMIGATVRRRGMVRTVYA